MKILFVCTGNICRSPTAEAMFVKAVCDAGLQEKISCESAGTHGYHIGEHPDSRTVAAAKKRGVEMGHLLAQRVLSQDYDTYDLILAMDAGHMRILQKNKPAACKAKLAMYLEYAGITHTTEVPDPYYDGVETFERVLDLTEEASAALVEKLR